MASSTYPSTPETTYNNRICRVLLGPCSDQLRDVLRHHVPPRKFPNIVRQYRKNLPRLSASQRDLILPRTGNYSGDYSDMDISLLYLLLRNLCSTWIPQHVNGWGNSPDTKDFTVSANIERIRETRNKISHSTSTYLSQAEFNDIWSDIRRAITSMDIYLGNGNKYEKEIDFLRTETMDPEQAQFYTEQLRKQVEEDKSTREKVIKLQESISDQQEVLRAQSVHLAALDSNVQRTDTEVQSHKREINKIKHQMQQPYTLPKEIEDSHIAELETLDDQEEIIYSRCKQRQHAILGNYGNLRRWIQSINESEADRIRILPLKEDDTIEVDRIYVPLSIVDEFKIHTSRTTDKNTISELTPEKMFYIAPGKPARFIFMLGDAGYGKTVQCRRIAKSWCKAWTAENTQHHIDVKVINSENTENGKLHEWEKILKDFEFLFYVPMRDVNNQHVSVKDIIYDYYLRFDILREYLDDILNVLKDTRCKCLIILDGLDEWNISESERKYLQNKGIPNCEDMLSCTLLFTMRSWRFMEVESICRRELFDRIIRLHGFDSKGFENLTTNMLCNYFNIERHSQEFVEQCANVRKKVSSLPELGSLMKIPLLAVFFILTWHEKIETGHSLTTFYLSMTEALMKKSQIQPGRTDTSQLPVSSILKNFPYVSSQIPEISRLGQLAFEGLDSQGITFVLADVRLEDSEVKETVNLFLRIGILIKHDASGQIHENNLKFSFLHKTIREFMYTLCLVYDKSEADIVNYVKEKVLDIEKTLELSTVLTFISGLFPSVGCKVSSYIAELASADKGIRLYRDNFANETFYKVFHLFNLQLSCYREVRGGKTIEDFQENEMKFILSDIFLHGNDTDRLTIREAADVLHYHAKDIISLYMKLIPDNNKEGITNVELETFLADSESLSALNIDGYHGGNCRLINCFSQKTVLSNLRTLGFHNVAFTDNILTDFLTRDESKKRIKALGLFYIKPTEDLVVDYQYQFLSVYRFSSAMSGYVQKRRRISVSERPLYLRQERRQPLLNVVLNVLPEYHDLITLHVSYMDSEVDRQLLLEVVPKIKTLEHFGYHGSSIYETPNDEYDLKVIKALLDIKRLQGILLSQISVQESIPKFTTMSRLKEISLEQFEMKQSNWMIFAKSVSSIETLSKVVLCDTNIDEEALKMLEKLSLTIVKDDSKEWRECEEQNSDS